MSHETPALVPNNTSRAEFRITEPNAAGAPTAVTGLSLTIRVAASSGATAAIGSLSYSATEYTGEGAGTYYADLPGAQIDTDLNNATYLDQEVYIQAVSGTVIRGYRRARVRLTREF